MKKLLLALLFVPALALADSVEDEQDYIVDMAAEIISQTKNVEDLSKLSSASREMEGVLQILNGSGGASPGAVCFKFLVDKNYSLSTAKSTCKGIQTKGAFDCFENLVNKNYSLSTAKSNCQDLGNQYESSCFSYLVEKNYSLSTAKSFAKKINTAGELDCFVDLVEKNYSLSTAQNNCEGF